jgi:hypothetical protein
MQIIEMQRFDNNRKYEFLEETEAYMLRIASAAELATAGYACS